MCISYNPFSLRGKTILVTGASSGIGRATAIECSKLGANVIITARNKERLEKTFSQLEGAGHKMVLADLSDLEQRVALVESCPVLDGISLNAGIVNYVPIRFIKDDNLGEMLSVNTISPMVLFTTLLKKKKLNKAASIVFTSSSAGLGRGAIGNGMYTASKGALSAFVSVAAKEVAPQKIRVNAVCPSMIQTEMTVAGALTEEQLKQDMGHYPLGRWGKPEEVAWAIIYLLSDASAFTTGINLRVNGGI